LAETAEDYSAAERVLTKPWQLLTTAQRTVGACAQAFIDLHRSWAAVAEAGPHESLAAEWQARLLAMGK